ncbi:DoxX family membrane protein [soil metagenome]
METVFNETTVRESSRVEEIDASRPSYQAYQVLRVGFTIAPIVAGLDKFFHLLVNWDQYLPAFVNNLTGGYGHELLLVAGVIEIIAGLGVWFMPKVFGYVVSAWLLLIVVNLFMIPGYFDVALRDFGLALGAFALGRLASEYSN